MRALLAISTVLSLLIAAYCFLEYQMMPHAQYSKMLSTLSQAGINDPDLMARVRWDIYGVRTTLKPLLVVTSVQSVLMVTKKGVSQ